MHLHYLQTLNFSHISPNVPSKTYSLSLVLSSLINFTSGTTTSYPQPSSTYISFFHATSHQIYASILWECCSSCLTPSFVRFILMPSSVFSFDSLAFGFLRPLFPYIIASPCVVMIFSSTAPLSSSSSSSISQILSHWALLFCLGLPLIHFLQALGDFYFYLLWIYDCSRKLSLQGH